MAYIRMGKIPKTDQTIQFIGYFREIDISLSRSLFPPPKQYNFSKLEGFTCAITLDLDMTYYTIRSDPGA